MATLARLLVDADVGVDGVLSDDDLAARLMRTYEPPIAPPDGGATTRRPVADGHERGVGPRARRRAPARDVLGRRVAPHRGAERLPRPAAARIGAGHRCRSSWNRWARRRRRARSRRPGRPTWPTPNCAAANGFIFTARHSRQSEVLARREAELADGHASFRFSGYITASAPTEEELVTACEAVQHAASQARLVVRRLYGDQARAYTCTLPLARGLARR